MIASALRVLLAVLLATGVARAATVPEVFVYQGELSLQGAPFDGEVDLVFTLFDASEGGSVMTSQAQVEVPVSAGRFATTVQLDPPALGAHAARYVEIDVRVSGSGGYTTLLPRVALRPVPQAQTALHVRDGSIDAVAIASAAVVASVLQPAAVGSAALADAAVDTAAFADAAVTGSSIADADITEDRFAIPFPSQLGAVIAGSGLSGGSAGGGVMLSVDLTQTQARITDVCPIGESIAAFDADGSVLCEPLPGATLIRTLESQGDVGMYSQIVISRGLPVIAFRASAGSVRLIRCGNRACSASATVTELNTFATNGPIHLDLATDHETDPLLAWRRDGSGLTFVRCVHPDCATPLVVERFPLGTHPSVGHPDPGPAGAPVMIYTDESGINGDLNFARCAAVFCTDGLFVVEPIEHGSPKVGAWNAVAFDVAHRPMISYYSQDSGALRFARCASANCATQPTPVTIDAPATNDVGTYSDIALSLAGQPMMSYHDATAGTLRYAFCQNDDCTGTIHRRTLDATPGHVVGTHTSIARGADGLPIMSYHDATAGDLKVAHCGNLTCNPAAAPVTITTVDDGDGNDVGQWSSLAIGEDGLPIISYYDATAGDLKVVRCGNEHCQ